MSTITWRDKTLGVDDIVLSNKQTKFVNSFIKKYIKKTENSKNIIQKSRKNLADTKAVVGFRLSVKEMFYPIVGESSYGSHMKDIDGNEYIDITMGYGTHLLGNNPDCVKEALIDEFNSGVALGVRSKHAGEVADLILELTANERLVFSTTGTEAVMAAIRIARGETGKNLVAVFFGSYHGHSDLTYFNPPVNDGQNNFMPSSLGIPSNMHDNLLILEYGSEASLQQIEKNASKLAAVLVEPIQSQNPTFIPINFLNKLRDLTRNKGIVLIFDEMITGFRAHPAGAKGLLEIDPDLCTYGKIVGGGLPLSVVAGKAKYLNYIDGGYWKYGDDSVPPNKRVFFAGTCCQHPYSLKGAKAVLSYLKKAGPELQVKLNSITDNFCNELNKFFIDENLPMKMINFSSMFRLQMPSNLDILYYLLVYKGLYICEWRNCFLSTAHTEQDIQKIISIVKDCVYELKDAGFMEGMKEIGRV